MKTIEVLYRKRWHLAMGLSSPVYSQAERGEEIHALLQLGLAIPSSGGRCTPRNSDSIQLAFLSLAVKTPSLAMVKFVLVFLISFAFVSSSGKWK